MARDETASAPDHDITRLLATYGDEPLGSAGDDFLSHAVRDLSRRRASGSLVTVEDRLRGPLLVYAERMAALSVRRESPELLERGLAARRRAIRGPSEFYEAELLQIRRRDYPWYVKDLQP